VGDGQTSKLIFYFTNNEIRPCLLMEWTFDQFQTMKRE